MKAEFLLCLAAVFFSCSTGDNDGGAVEQDPAAIAAQPLTVDLSSEDLPLQITMPDKGSTQGAQAAMGWHEEEGWFGVRAGDHFGLHITEEPGDIPRLKRDLEGDLLRKHTILAETLELVVYRTEFPDDPDLVFVHFYRVIHSGDRTFVVESDPEGKFNEADVERMRSAVNPKAPV